MLTVKYIDDEGGEAVYEAVQVNWIGERSPGELGPGVQILPADETVGSSIFYPLVRSDVPKSLQKMASLFVMNRHGATVATYRL